MRVIILRGPSGSGKSTWIEKNFGPRNTAVCSADHFFIGDDGEYRFDPKMLGEAHIECQTWFHHYLKQATAGYDYLDVVIVDNTNVRLWEMAYYIGLSRVFGIEPEIVRIEADVKECIRRNVHNVPAETIRRMNASMEQVPKHFAKETVIRN